MDKYILNEEEREMFTYFIIKGIPPVLRMRLWIISSGALNEIKSNPSYYRELLELTKEVPSLYSDIIEKDIERTFSDEIKENPKYSSMLINILTCFSIRNSSIGYCQGFNFIVLRILEIIKDEVILFLFNIEYLY